MLLIVPAATYGQILKPGLQYFEKLDYRHGLTQSSTTCIFKDSRGYMWFGTQDGLNQYDGYAFISYRHEPFDENSLGTSSIVEILEYNGSIWIATFSDGLYRFEPDGRFINYRPDQHGKETIGSDLIDDINIFNGNFWIPTNNGLIRFDPESGESRRYTHDPDDPSSIPSNLIESVTVDKNGQFWLGCEKGLICFDPDKETFALHTIERSRKTSANSIMYLTFIDSHETIWVASYGGLEQFDPATGTFRNIFTGHPFDSINCIAEDEDGFLCIGTRGNGFIRLDPKSFRYETYKHDRMNAASISSDEIKSLYCDEFGTIWIGTINGGVNKVKKRAIQFANYGELTGSLSLNTRLVYTVLEDSEGIIWAGTGGGGLNKIDLKHGKTTYYVNDPADNNSISHNTVLSLLEDSEGLFWVGTAGGGFRILDRETGKFHHYAINDKFVYPNSSYILGMMEDDQGRIWFSTPHGLNRIDKESGLVHLFAHNPSDPSSISSNYVLSTFQCSSGDIFVGTNNGLNIYNPEDDSFTKFKHDINDPSSISDNIAWQIFEDSKDRIWVGTWGGGLNEFDRKTGEFRHYTTKDGLPNNVVYGILEDNAGNLWLSTNEGISRFDPETKNFRNYASDDGLICDEFNMGACHITENGAMYFGGMYGFTSFNPDTIERNKVIPKVLITSFSGSGKKNINLNQMPYVDEIVLPFDQNSFSIEFASLDFTSPAKNRYRYRLEGFDTHWIEADQRRSAWYTDLRPGEYRFRALGSNSDGVWNTEGATLRILISPPFWATLWFKILLVGMAAALATGVYTFRVGLLEERSKRLRSLTDHLHSAIETERNHISREIHDELGQALTAIKMSISLIKRSLTVINESQEKRFETITNLIDTTIQKTRNISENLRPSRLDELGLVAAIEWYVNEYENRTGIESALYIDTDNIDLGRDNNIALFRIVQESLTNVARHSGATETTVSLIQTPEAIELEITDNGTGIREEQLKNMTSFGIIGIRERALKLDGTLEIKPHRPSGTCVSVIIPRGE